MTTKRIPKVRMATPQGRPIQLRYFCPVEQREIRISTGTHDAGEGEQQKKDLEAKLRLGIDAKPKAQSKPGPAMAWESFRLEYTRLHLDGLRDKTSIDSESRLDIAERIIKPQTLADMATRETLTQLQQELTKGAESRYDPTRPRSPHSVRSHLASVMAALNWAALNGWLENVPKIRKVKTSKLRAMKGRPLALEEFERMLAKVPVVVGTEAAPSWDYLLRGLWTSAYGADARLLGRSEHDLPRVAETSSPGLAHSIEATEERVRFRRLQSVDPSTAEKVRPSEALVDRLPTKWHH